MRFLFALAARLAPRSPVKQQRGGWTEKPGSTDAAGGGSSTTSTSQGTRASDLKSRDKEHRQVGKKGKSKKQWDGNDEEVGDEGTTGRRKQHKGEEEHVVKGGKATPRKQTKSVKESVAESEETVRSGSKKKQQGEAEETVGRGDEAIAQQQERKRKREKAEASVATAVVTEHDCVDSSSQKKRRGQAGDGDGGDTRAGTGSGRKLRTPQIDPSSSTRLVKGSGTGDRGSDLPTKSKKISKLVRREDVVQWRDRSEGVGTKERRVGSRDDGRTSGEHGPGKRRAMEVVGVRQGKNGPSDKRGAATAGARKTYDSDDDFSMGPTRKTPAVAGKAATASRGERETADGDVRSSSPRPDKEERNNVQSDRASSTKKRRQERYDRYANSGENVAAARRDGKATELRQTGKGRRKDASEETCAKTERRSDSRRTRRSSSVGVVGGRSSVHRDTGRGAGGACRENTRRPCVGEAETGESDKEAEFTW